MNDCTLVFTAYSMRREGWDMEACFCKMSWAYDYSAAQVDYVRRFMARSNELF